MALPLRLACLVAPPDHQCANLRGCGHGEVIVHEILKRLNGARREQPLDVSCLVRVGFLADGFREVTAPGLAILLASLMDQLTQLCRIVKLVSRLFLLADELSGCLYDFHVDGDLLITYSVP